MTISDLKDQILNVTNIEDETRLGLIISAAINELWYGIDLPGTTFQVYVYDDNYPLITLPPEVHIIKAVKRVMEDNVELNTPVPFYQSNNLTSTYRWQILGPTALQRSINNATRLTFSIHEAESTDIAITINGRSKHARSLTETVTIEAGETSAVSTNAYETASLIEKNRATSSDVLISVAGEPSDLTDDNIVGRIFNHEKSSPCLQVNLTNDIQAASYQAPQGDPFHCFDVIYRERPPIAERALAIFMPPYDQTLFLKCLAYSKLYDGMDMASLDQRGSDLAAMNRKAESVSTVQKITTARPGMISGQYGNL